MLQKNRSGEVIEQTSNKKFVTEWKLDHHEILSIFNIFRNVTKGAIDSTDTNLNHEFSCNLNLELDWRIIRLRATSIVKLTCLLYLVKQLHYFTTRQIVTHDLSEKILCFYDRAKEL